jgi:hypothetical protein
MKLSFRMETSQTFIRQFDESQSLPIMLRCFTITVVYRGCEKGDCVRVHDESQEL